MKHLERELQKEVLIRLHAMGVQAWSHTVEVCTACGERPRRGTGLAFGAADIIAIWRGRAIAIEMKRPGYSPSDVRPEQRAFLATVERAGGTAGVASSWKEVEAILARVPP